MPLGAPDWQIDPPKVEPVCGDNGHPIWFRIVREPVLDGRGEPLPDVWREHERADGRNSKSRRPYPGAYTKLLVAPDRHHGIVERMRYEVWRSAHDFLVADLAGKLDDVELKPSPRLARPSKSSEPMPAIWRDPFASRTCAGDRQAVGPHAAVAFAPHKRPFAA